MAKDNGYDVGYGKPPASNRFEKGRSGNPRGRPKGARNLSTVLENALADRVTVTVNGKRSRISKLEAAITQMVNKAAGGDNRALAQLLPQIQTLELRKDQLDGHMKTNQSDQQVMANILARMGNKDRKDGI